MTSPCCTYGCDSSPGCLGGQDKLAPVTTHDSQWWTVTEWRDSRALPIDFCDERNRPWDALSRAESVLIWLIVAMGVGLTFYMGVVAWRLIVSN